MKPEIFKNIRNISVTRYVSFYLYNFIKNKNDKKYKYLLTN